MLRVVIDTNLWISALLDSSNALAIVERLEHDQFQLVFAELLIKELANVLARPKFSRIRTERTEQLFALIREKATFVELELVASISRDPKDDPYLTCARVADCDFLVTGDRDMLVLEEHHRTRIVTPRQFLHALESQV